MSMHVSLRERERRRLIDRERWGKAQEEEQALQAHFEALTTLEGLRGGAVTRAGGKVRAEGRDGLLSLYEKGVIDDVSFRAGLLYRNAFETIERGPRSQLAREAIASTGPHEALAWAERRSHLFGRLRAMEGLARTARELWGLRLCAGEGRTLRSIVGGGRSHVAASEALKTVLGAIADERGMRRRTA